MRTITVKKQTGGGKFTPGWKEVEITKAAYGDFNGTKYIDCFFKDYPDSLNLRIYEKKGKDGEEFAIGRLFRFANAGIMVNVYLYKDGKYSRVLSSVAPAEFTNELESFSSDDVVYWKGAAEKYFQNFVANKLQNTEDSSESTTNNDEVIPF